ncbi:hypothetical protein HZA38_04210 [Candidatus Peregrinibacteria bacterium]|nr:hypothetical protein [Candidatus Peregrinibacteria bacterium]
MEINILIKKLTAIGLSESEARVYIAALEAGTSPVSAIAEKANLNRVTTYSILKRLFHEGIVGVNEQKGMRFFTAADPKVFVEDVEQKAKNLTEELPNLLALIGGQGLRPRVQFFEGLEGVQKAYKETLTAKTEILNYANSKNIRIHWPNYDEEYVSVRKNNKIFLRGLFPDDPYGKRVQREDQKYFRETRLLPNRHFRVENEIKIYDDNVFIASFDPNTFAIIIHSSAVAETQRQIFEIAWEHAVAKPKIKGKM